MVAQPRYPRLIPIAPAGGFATFLGVAAIVVVIPTGLLESFVVDSGVASLIDHAAPPLGRTARIVLALGFGGMAGAVAWSALFLLLGTRSVAWHGRRARPAGVPVVRRADAHPDAPPRRPVFASSDLGAPLMTAATLADNAPLGRPIRSLNADDEMPERPMLPEPAAVTPAAPTECDLPRDLDVPLATFDPEAILPVPREPVRPVEPLARPVEPIAVEPAAPEPATSIDSLLERLERSTRRAAPRPEPRPEARTGSLEETLATLRQMATRTA